MVQFDKFIHELSSTAVASNVYNQYADQHPESATRKANLSLYLRQMEKVQPKLMLVGEAPGYRGSRLTGVPFTSEHLLINNMPGLTLFGAANGYRLPIQKDKLRKEATATIIWSTMIEQNLMMLSWNAFPFHPHKTGNEMSNRTPLKKELALGEPFLLELISLFEIETVIAMGNKAYESLTKLGIECQKVRHPAQGGKNHFVEGIRQINLK